MDATGQAKDRLDAAYKLFKEKRFDESEGLFEALAGDPDLGQRAKSGLGLIYLEKGDATRAKRMFSEVLDEGHPTAEAYYGLGVIAEATDKGYARAQYEFALRVNPRHLGASRRLSRLEANKPTKVANVTTRAEPQPDAPRTKDPRQGVARRVRYRAERRGSARNSIQIHICEFVLDRVEGLDPISVHMAGQTTEGMISDGDVIAIDKLPRAGQILKTDKVHNISANADVTMSGSTFPLLISTLKNSIGVLALILVVLLYYAFK